MNRKNILLFVTTLMLIVTAFIAGTKSQSDSGSSKFGVVYAAGSQEAFDYLSANTSSYCGLIPQTVEGYSEDQNIQGACCGAMDFHRYKEQVEALRKYSDIPQIPEDPYNISVPLAKELFDYQKSIQLTSDEQKIYDSAMQMSEEGGPCCCRCWRWTAFEGQAKFLIREHGFTADQVAEVWELEDGCGGSGHTGGIDTGH